MHTSVFPPISFCGTHSSQKSRLIKLSYKRLDCIILKVFLYIIRLSLVSSIETVKKMIWHFHKKDTANAVHYNSKGHSVSYLRVLVIERVVPNDGAWLTLLPFFKSSDYFWHFPLLRNLTSVIDFWEKLCHGAQEGSTCIIDWTHWNAIISFTFFTFKTWKALIDIQFRYMTVQLSISNLLECERSIHFVCLHLFYVLTIGPKTSLPERASTTEFKLS